MNAKLTEVQRSQLVDAIILVMDSNPNYSQITCFKEGLKLAGFENIIGVNSSAISRYYQLACVKKHGSKESGQKSFEPVLTNNPDNPYERARFHQKGLIDCIREFDTERDRLMARIKEIDDLVAKYKKLT